MSALNNYYNAAAAGVATMVVLGGTAIYRWCIKHQSSDSRLTHAASRVLRASVEEVDSAPPLRVLNEVADVLPAVDSARQQALSSAASSPASSVISPAEMTVAAKRQQEVQLTATASAFFNNPLEAITPEQYAEFLMAAEGYNLLSAEERSAIVLQVFLSKKDEATTLVAQLSDDAYINTIIGTRKCPLQQSIQERISRVRQLRGIFGNDGEIHAAYTRGDMDEMRRLHKEYSYIGGGHFNPDINIDKVTGRYRVARSSHIDKLQQAIGTLGATVTDECQQKAEFWRRLLSSSEKTD